MDASRILEDVGEPLDDSVDEEIDDVAELSEGFVDKEAEIDCPESPFDPRKSSTLN